MGRIPHCYRLPAVRHVIVTRFSVPRPQDPATARCHAEREWLDRRLDLFRRFFVPSVERLGVPTVLLCSQESAPKVGRAIEDLRWAEVVVQDEWNGGWTGAPDQILTRLDSDDAVHEGWFRAIEGAPSDVEVHCTKRFLRLDIETGRLRAYRRSHPSPLAAFRDGRNPFACDHSELERSYRTSTLKGPYLLQIYHGGNLSSRRPKLLLPAVARKRLAEFGIE